MYDVQLAKQAEKDAVLLERAGLKQKAAGVIAIIRDNPFQTPPPYEKLKSCRNTYSRRINRRHRLVYEVFPCGEGLADKGGAPCEGTVKVIRMWTHYE
ncbi:MAG: Txe/YoeB family addiction module toxin [Oscillospiraceae bacterium]|jgi:Txe/YoeB family toxin of toxin-antitoxin system|nr:Txe/YoeB family addiction module toxin [Oscillospiraceae bacterium]